jgi:hypothetical protein
MTLINIKKIFIIISVFCIFSNCKKNIDSNQTVIEVPTDSLFERNLSDSIYLKHIKNEFYKSKDGHLYEKTTAYRNKKDVDSLVPHNYFNGNIPQDIEPNSFEVLDGWYAKDKNFVYYYRAVSGGMLISKIENADVKTFEVLKGEYRYAKDNKSVFMDSEKLDSINSNNMEIIKNENNEIEKIVNKKKY